MINRNYIKIREWERGTGETLACGTGCCATAVACILNGYTEDEVTVHVLGGDIRVFWNREENVVYIDGLMTHDFYATLTDKKIIVEKYKIKNSSDYFKIIEELEKRGIQYYVYA